MIAQGWQCPVCQAVNAPSVTTCSHQAFTQPVVAEKPRTDRYVTLEQSTCASHVDYACRGCMVEVGKPHKADCRLYLDEVARKLEERPSDA